MKSNKTNLETMNTIFETSLKPLKSKYARAIFNVFLESKEIDYLTTLDIQKGLYSYQITLSKKEINAWLKSLNSSSLISKAEERGKPTTIDYEDRYTYDKWSITPKGLLVSYGLNVLRNTIEQVQDNPQNDMGLNILSIIQSSNNFLSMNDLKDMLLNQQEFDSIHQGLMDDGLIFKTVKKPSLFTKFLSSIGIPVQTKIIIQLTDKGKKKLG